MLLYSFFFFFILLLIPLSHQNLRSLLLSENKRRRIETLTQGAQWTQFVVHYFSSTLFRMFYCVFSAWNISSKGYRDAIAAS